MLVIASNTSFCIGNLLRCGAVQYLCVATYTPNRAKSSIRGPAFGGQTARASQFAICADCIFRYQIGVTQSPEIGRFLHSLTSLAPGWPGIARSGDPHTPVRSS